MKTKYTLLTILLTALALFAAACASGTDTTLPVEVVEPASTAITALQTTLNLDYENATSLRNQLALGLLRLEGSPQAVTPQQAAELFPLWQAIQALESDQNAAQAEIEALQNQLIESLSPEQIQAIAALQLTNDDLNAFYAEMGLEVPTGESQGMQGANKDMTEDERAAFRATRQASEAGGTGEGQGAGRERRNALTAEVIALLIERAAQ